jgi:ferrous iron transport protein B
MNLCEAPLSTPLRILGVSGGEAVHRRLLALGFHPGDVIELDSAAILRGPMLVRNVASGGRVAIGRGIARKIVVEAAEASLEVPSVVFVGQPNCGKSTLFNSIAGLKAETSNFPGTTVKHTHSRVAIEGRLLDIIDLPGTYSLCPSDPAEKTALSHLFSEKPDLIINVVDASILGRSLEFTLELVELGRPMVVALNMIDLAEQKGVTVDPAKLSARLGVPVVPVIAVRGRGIKELLDEAFRALERPSPPRPPAWSRDVEGRVEEMARLLPGDFPLVAGRRFTAVKMIEADRLFCDTILGELEPGLKREVERVRGEIEAARSMPAYEVVAAERHHLALKIAEESSRVARGRGVTWDKRIDAVIMHPFYGYVILVGVFMAFFFVIFKVGNPLEGLLLKPFAAISLALKGRLGSGLAFHLADGLIQGIGGGVAIVLPYFIPLLILMSFLEDVGYMARAGFLLDSFMHKIGLHGKSVSPFILGFGCNVPAIISTRILESRRDRVITSLLIPFIPCSARTTIILALVAFALGPWAALAFYAANILLVAVLGKVLSTFTKAPSPGLILEIPTLKLPSIDGVLKKTYFQLRSFIAFAWPILIAGSVVLGLLQSVHADRLINTVLSPLVAGALGLPRELGVTLVFGFLRKELSLIMMLQALGTGYGDLLSVITRQQLLVFTVFVSFFIPCLSTFAILWKEVGKRVAFLSVGLSISVAVLLSWLIRVIL